MPEKVNYNPDILSCLANLSSDEVFTPPEIANAMLDMLPQELFTSPDTKFLDPGCKSGVFLREIAKRLNEGLKDRIPDVEQRMDHIMKNQLFAIAITQITGLLSRRSVYCSKDASGRFSVVKFEDPDGNIRFRRVEHTWVGGKCSVCGASKEIQDRGKELETHAYEFIHMDGNELKELKNMKFDVIIGNPPYQMEDGGNNASATPIYHIFVEQAKKLKPRYLTMITPSRWFTGGKGLDSFRSDMLSDRHIREIVDYQNAKECFPGVSIGGGVNYFLWDRDNAGDCQITNVSGGKRVSMVRSLQEFPVFVRSNEAIEILKKVSSFREPSISPTIGTRNPYGLDTKTRGSDSEFKGAVEVYSSKGRSWIPQDSVSNVSSVYKYKTMLSCICSEHAGEPDKDGMYKVLSTVCVIPPKSVCTDSYLVCFPTDDKDTSQNYCNYLRTKFCRFLIIILLSSIHITAKTMTLIPMQDFSKPWTDEELYKKYSLTDDEIAFIESMIKPMDGGDDA